MIKILVYGFRDLWIDSQKKKKIKYTYTLLIITFYSRLFKNILLSVKKKNEGKHFLFITGRENRINYYSEVQKSFLYLQISFSFQLLEYHCLRIFLSSPRNILTDKEN